MAMAPRVTEADALKVLTDLGVSICSPEGRSAGPCIEVAKSPSHGFMFYGPGQAICTQEILLLGFNQFPKPFLAFVYLLWLLWLFLGVSLAADTFMNGITVITSTTRKVKRRNDLGELVEVEVPVWNWVVANITLMALGTSAPEILLATVETCITLGKPAGEIGPSCIVGSAAYNSLVITAVCTIALPPDTMKRISQYRVFLTTCVWSIWAYIWMLVVYSWWTPNQVTLEEALLTLAQFVLLVVNAWVVDTQPWKKGNKVVSSDPESQQQLTDSVKPNHLMMYRQILSQRTSQMTRKENELARTRTLSGPATSIDTLRANLNQINPLQQHVMFRSSAYSFLESAKVARLSVVRVGGDLNTVIKVAWKTIDNDAIAGLDYAASEGVLIFTQGEAAKAIEIAILDDDVCEPDVSFYVCLELMTKASNVVIDQPKVEVTIVDDDDAGVLGFELPSYEVSYNANHPVVDLKVVRRRGQDGRVEVEYETVDQTAVAGKDFKGVSGLLVFEAGEVTQRLRLTLLPSANSAVSRTFKVVLKSPTGGAELSNRKTALVTMVQRALTKVPSDQAVLLSKADMYDSGDTGSKGSDGGSSDKDFDLWGAWRQQIFDSLSVSPPEEGSEMDWGSVMFHYITITFKFVLALMVPPPDWKSGYPCFIAALAAIVGIVYIVEGSATLFGCVVGLGDFMTGISLVAAGTSLPDTLASRIAAVKDKDADAAIGNITGSNCVNVFLGLGVPWLIGSVYYMAQDVPYVTPAGDLSFSILLFAIACAAFVGTLTLRRYQGGELGGSSMARWLVFAFLVSMWALFLMLSGLRTFKHI